MSRNEYFKIGEIVYFQAYPEHEKIKGKIIKIGTKSEIGMFQLDENDQRLFYELETVEYARNHTFTRTTINWISRI